MSIDNFKYAVNKETLHTSVEKALRFIEVVLPYQDKEFAVRYSIDVPMLLGLLEMHERRESEREICKKVAP